MKDEEYESNLICSIEESSDLSNIRLKGVSIDDFRFHPNVFNFICEHESEYGSVPSQSLIKAEFPAFEFVDASEFDIGYLADQVVKAATRRRSENVIDKGIDLLATEDDPNKALDYLLSKLGDTKRTRHVTSSFTDRDALRRYDLFLRKRQMTETGRPIGISTGLKVLDERLIGMNPGSVNLIVGYTGVGKSWISLAMGVKGYIDGMKVLYISPEMPIEEMENRWDSIYGAHLSVQLSSEALIYGQEIDDAEYKKFLEASSNRADWITADSDNGRPFDSDAISSLADEHSPDLLVVDGLYLIRGRDGSIGNWSSMVDIANSLKALATRKKCVVVATTQAADGDNPGDSSTAYSRYLNQPMDLIFWLNHTSDLDPNKRTITITKMRSGLAPRGKITINFYPDEGRIG